MQTSPGTHPPSYHDALNIIYVAFQQPREMDHNSGGFFHAGPGGLLSPPPSSVASTSTAGSTLPSPRSHPLKAGSAKELAFRNYVDKHISSIQRRYALKFSGENDEADDMGGGLAAASIPGMPKRQSIGADAGYESFREVARDIEKVVEVVWVSGTPGLQIPYLLTLALLAVNYIPGFSAAPRTMFRLLDKLDSAFASLIQGKDIETGEPLPGMNGRKGMTGTEKVRIKSLVERTRVTVVELMNKGDYEEEMDEQAETEDEEEDMGDYDYDAGTDFAMEVAKVYDKTLVELRDTLEGEAIGLG